MLSSLFKASSAFVLPGGLIFLVAIGFLRPRGLPSWSQVPVSAFPYVVLGFGLIFGWYFSSARMILSLASLVLADMALVLFPPGENSGPSQTVFSAVSFLLPLNFLAYVILKEETISIIRNVIHFVMLLMQPILVLWLCQPAQQDLASTLQMPYFPMLSPNWTPVPQIGLIAFLVAGIMHFARFAVRRDPLDGAATWALAAIFLGYHSIQFGWQPRNFFGTAGLILFVGLVQSSYRRTYRDDLTGIEGRAAYEEATAQLGRNFAIAILAIDQLKTYAGAHGKTVVEQILKLVAPKVQAACHRGRVFRISGEELTLLFHNQSSIEALVEIESIRKLIESTQLVLHGRDRVWENSRGTNPGSKDRELPVTVSIGVADSYSDETSLSLVNKSAYRALYEAKSAGGNVAKRGTVMSRPPTRNNRSIVAKSQY